jgi:hypothetical protein
VALILMFFASCVNRWLQLARQHGSTAASCPLCRHTFTDPIKLHGLELKSQKLADTENALWEKFKPIMTKGIKSKSECESLLAETNELLRTLPKHSDLVSKYFPYMTEDTD